MRRPKLRRQSSRVASPNAAPSAGLLVAPSAPASRRRHRGTKMTERRPEVFPRCEPPHGEPRLDRIGPTAKLATRPCGCSLVVKLLSSKEVSSVRFRPPAPMRRAVASLPPWCRESLHPPRTPLPAVRVPRASPLAHPASPAPPRLRNPTPRASIAKPGIR